MFWNRCLPIIVLVWLAGQPARAGFVDFPEIDASMSGNRVVLTVYDTDDKTTHTWKSEEYEGVSEITSTDGIAAYTFTKDGWYYVKLAVYDPGDRKFHRWQSRLSNAISSPDISGGVVAWIDDYWNCVEALAYDPSDRDWHEYRSPAFTGIDDMINDSGIVAFTDSLFRVTIAAAYDLEDNKWRSCQFGPSLSGLIVTYDNVDGVVSVLAGDNVSAAAYDIGDNKWHMRHDLTDVDTDPVSDDAIVAFARGRTVYSLAYDAHDRDWKYWSYYARGLIDDVDIEDGYVIYTIDDIDYRRFSARKPKALFEIVKSSCADSMLYHFADTSFGAITTWSWDFGDGSKSTDRSPIHTFKKIGDHTITLKVTGPGGTHSVSRDIFLTSPTYTVTYSAGTGGSIAGVATQKIPYGHDGTIVTAVAETGYHFVSWSDNTTATARREETVSSSMALTATFAINQYTVTFKTDGTIGASITGTTPQTVNHGASCTSVKAVAPNSQRFTGWKSGNTLYSSSSTVTVTNLKSNMTLTATFATGAPAETWAVYQ